MNDILPLRLLAILFLFVLPGCHRVEATHVEHHDAIVVTHPLVKDVVVTEPYVCQIHSSRHIEVCALEQGYLHEIHVQEGQLVKQGDLMFKIFPAIYEAKLASAEAEAQVVQIEYNNTKSLFERHVVSKQELALAEAKLAKALAEVKLAKAELNFTEVKAPFDGIIDRLHEQLGSLIEEGDVLTTLSDNSVMWVYFNVPEARYLEYRSGLSESHVDADDDDADDDDADDDDANDDDPDDDVDDDTDDDDEVDGDDHELSDDDAGVDGETLHLELVLANGKTFPQPGRIGAIEADFNNETGNIAFRADFPNPDALLRHGQTGTVLIHRTMDDAIVIPQRSSYEILDKRYVYVVGEDGVVHQREIVVQHEMEDVFVVGDGLAPGDKIVLEGVRQVHDGQQVEYESINPEEVLAHLKYHAE